MTSTYQPPPFARRPPSPCPYSLEVIKNGVVLEQVALRTAGQPNKTFMVLGRQAQSCDVVLQHESISRAHAVVQWAGPEDTPASSEADTLLLCDLGSTHGTFVNHKRLEPRRYTKLEVGTIIKFGESTRIYHVCGPDELRPDDDWDRVAAKREAKREAKRKAAATASCVESMSPVQSAPEFGEAAWERLSDAARVRSLGKWRQLSSKIVNLEREEENISRKRGEEGQLSDGQEQRLARVGDQLRQARSDLLDLENELNEAVAREAHGGESLGAVGRAAGRKRGAHEVGEDADYEFFDRTRTRKDGSQHVPATFESASAEVARLEKRHAEVERALDATRKASAPRAQDPEDSLDAFMQANRTTLRAESVKDLEAELRGIDADLARQRSLRDRLEPAFHKIASRGARAQGTDVSSFSQVDSLPADRPVRVAGAVAETGPGHAPRTGGCFSSSSSSSSSGAASARDQRKSDALLGQVRANPVPLAEPEIDEEPEWVPPALQTGDGRTKLNALYNGRY